MSRETFDKIDDRSAPRSAEMLRAILPADLTVLDSEALFRSAVEVVILHEGRVYRLRKTRNGGLLKFCFAKAGHPASLGYAGQILHISPKASDAGWWSRGDSNP